MEALSGSVNLLLNAPAAEHQFMHFNHLSLMNFAMKNPMVSKS